MAISLNFRLALPAPLRGAELGSFAHDTIIRRLPEIGRRTLAENDFPPPIVACLQELIAGLPDGRVRLLQDPGAPDEAAWNGYITPYLNQTWLEVPWFFAETYFYRRMLEATGYFQPGAWQTVDPNGFQKQQGLAQFRTAIQAACALVNERLASPAAAQEEAQLRLAALLKLNLWGNQADLSMWPVGQAARHGYAKRHDHAKRPDHADDARREAHLVRDDSEATVSYLHSIPPGRVDFILDNAGLEFVLDLLLADYLLGSRLVQQVVFHLKPHPTFVSDATIPDVRQTVDFLAGLGDNQAQAVSRRLQAHLEGNRLQLHTHFFWTSPLACWDMPADLASDLRLSALLISKGDANYRRLIGDRHWPDTLDFAQALHYAPAPLLALRVSKSEPVVGLCEGQAAALDQVDAHWRTNGRWGMIQFTASSSLVPTNAGCRG